MDENDKGENDKGAVLGRLYVTDKDDARHPHGQHGFTFEVGGKPADDQFEVVDGMLKLKEDESLNFENSDEVVLKITATDKGKESARESVSAEITIKVKDLKTGDGPAANMKIGDWWVTVDERLDADELIAGDWLSFSLDTTKPDAAFEDEEKDDLTDLTYSVQVTNADGTGSLTMEFDLNDDPDFTAGGEPVLVLYTWSNIVGGRETVISSSTSPHPLPLLEVDAQGRPTPLGGPFTRDYAGETVKATVQYFERNPDGTIEMVTDEDEVEVAAAAGSARLEFSKDGTSWDRETTPAIGNADAASGVTTAITLAVNANRDANSGDGAVDGEARYYRVVYTYNDENGRPVEMRSDPVGKLGFLAATIGGSPTGGGDPIPSGNAVLGHTSGTATPVGRTIQADTRGNPAEVQWQMWVDANRNTTVQENEWENIDGNPDGSLTITNAHAGSQLRVKVTCTHEDNPATTDANENGWIRWIENTEAVAGPVAQGNALPTRTQPTEEIRVNITQTTDAMGKKTSVDGSGTGSVAGLFLDSNGDDLTYTLVTATGPVSSSPSDFIAVVAGGTTGLRPGSTVYVSGYLDSSATGDQTQTLAIDSDGNITYYTNSVTAHDATPTDGAGNTLVFDVNANDGTGDSAQDVTVTVRINVSPTAINDVGPGTALASTEGMAAALTTQFTIAETTDATATQVARPVVSLDGLDQNLVIDPYGTHDVIVSAK